MKPYPFSFFALLFITVFVSLYPMDAGAQTLKKMTVATAPSEFDAAFDNRAGKIYFFKGTKYVRITASTGKVDAGYPRTIKDNWIGIPWESIDAALYREFNKRIYLFKGSQYVRITGNKVDAGYPKPITEWKGLPFKKVDAAFDYGNGKIYFFSGNVYARVNSSNTTTDKGYPVAINAGNWGGIKLTKIDAAFRHHIKNKNFFLYGSMQYRLTGTKLDAGYPKKSSLNWPGKSFSPPVAVLQTRPYQTFPANTKPASTSTSTRPTRPGTKFDQVDLTKVRLLEVRQPDVFITFENKTDRTLEVFYVNKDGTERKYSNLTMVPGATKKQGTFKDTKWRVKDQASGLPLDLIVATDKNETLSVQVDPGMTFPTTQQEVTIEWINPASETTHPDIVVEALISSMDNQMEQVMVNGVILGEEAITTVQEEGKLKLSANLTLIEGMNTMGLQVFTNDGQFKKAEDIQIIYKEKKSLETTKPNLYFFGIGVSKYMDEDFNTLVYPAKDVKDLKEAFEAQAGGTLFDRVFTRLLLDEEATERNIRKEMTSFFKDIRETDYVMFVVSSHGIVASDDVFYILQHDVEKDYIEATGISEHFIEDRLQNLPASKILIIDACNSGGISGDRLKAVNATERTVNQMLKKVQKNSKGTYILTSSGENEFSVENEEWENGAFTEAILMGLKGQSYTLKEGGRTGEVVEVTLDKGVLSMDELFHFIQAVTADLSGYKQEPYLEKSGQELPIYVVE